MNSSTTAFLTVTGTDITLAVLGRPDVVADLRRITAPFYAPVTVATGDVWTLELDLAAPPGAVGPASDGEPVHSAQFDVSGRRITVHCADPAWLQVFGTRYARTLVRALTIGRGAVPLHGAAVDVAGTGVILVGDKMAGKTTSALSLVRTGAALVSNDDVLLVRGSTGAAAGTGEHWRMLGGPRSIGIRLGSLAEHRPALTTEAVAAATAAHPANREDKHFLHPSRLGGLGGAARVEAPAHVVVELDCVPGPSEHRRLDVDEATAVVNTYLEDAADRRRFELIRALGAAPPRLTAETIDSLARGLEFHRFSHPVTGWVDELLGFVEDTVAACDGTVVREVSG